VTGLKRKFLGKTDLGGLRPTTEWLTLTTTLTKDRFDVATDLYYVNVLILL
jgi:hypothetical protein